MTDIILYDIDGEETLHNKVIRGVKTANDHCKPVIMEYGGHSVTIQPGESIDQVENAWWNEHGRNTAAEVRKLKREKANRAPGGRARS